MLLCQVIVMTVYLLNRIHSREKGVEQRFLAILETVRDVEGWLNGLCLCNLLLLFMKIENKEKHYKAQQYFKMDLFTVLFDPFPSCISADPYRLIW